MDGPEEATRESAWPEAKLQPRKRGRGSLDEVDVQFLWESCIGTLLLLSPINTPAEQQRGRIQRLELRVFFRFSLCKFLVISFRF